MIKYVPGGHYTHHFDALFENNDTRTFGNRIATFMGVFTTAEEGGGRSGLDSAMISDSSNNFS